MTDPRVRYLTPLAAWLAAAVAVTLLEGTPERLPAVALGSTALLHALRAAGLFALGVAVATVLTRAGAGRLPTQLSTTGVGYEGEETAETTTALLELQGQVDRLQTAVDALAGDVDTPPRST